MTGGHDGDAHTAEASAGAPPVAEPRNRRRRNTIVAVILGVVVVWAVASILIVVEADKHVSDGANEITEVHQSLSADQLLSGKPVIPLEAAESNFASANSLLRSPVLWPIDVLPVLGRQLRSAQDLSVAAGQVSKTGVTVVHQSRELLDLPHTAGPERIAALKQLAILASTTHATLSQVALGPSQALLGPAGAPTGKVRYRAQPGPDHAGPHIRRRHGGGRHSGRTAELSPARREQRGNAVGVRHVPRSGQHRHQRRRHAPGRDAADLVAHLAQGAVPVGGDLERAGGSSCRGLTTAISVSRRNST